MSLMDKIKSLFSGGSSAGAHDHDHAGHDHAGHEHAHEPAPLADPSGTSMPERAEPTEAEDGESEVH